MLVSIYKNIDTTDMTDGEILTTWYLTKIFDRYGLTDDYWYNMSIFDFKMLYASSDIVITHNTVSDKFQEYFKFGLLTNKMMCIKPTKKLLESAVNRSNVKKLGKQHFKIKDKDKIKKAIYILGALNNNQEWISPSVNYDGDMEMDRMDYYGFMHARLD